MATPRSARDRLADIILWGEAAVEHVRTMDLADFEGDLKTQHAVIKCIEVIGEAAGHLMRMMPDHAERFPLLDLGRAYAARNQLSHGYFMTDSELIWLTVRKSVPVIVEQARRALDIVDNGAR